MCCKNCLFFGQLFGVARGAGVKQHRSRVTFVTAHRTQLPSTNAISYIDSPPVPGSRALRRRAPAAPPAPPAPRRRRCSAGRPRCGARRGPAPPPRPRGRRRRACAAGRAWCPTRPAGTWRRWTRRAGVCVCGVVVLVLSSQEAGPPATVNHCRPSSRPTHAQQNPTPHPPAAHLHDVIHHLPPAVKAPRHQAQRRRLLPRHAARRQRHLRRHAVPGGGGGKCR
jgi:hypothetical protein